MKKAFFDTETTALHPGNIAQLSAIIEDDNGNIEAKNYFFKIDYITQGAEEVCGRGVDFYLEASGGKVFGDYKDELLQLFSDSTLIAHNLKFDENFLSMEFWRQNITFTPADRFDTMVFFKDICKLPGRGSKYKNPKLVELVDFFNIDHTKVEEYSKQLFKTDDTGSFHDARYDTTSMFVAFQIYRESISGGDSWKKTFSL